MLDSDGDESLIFSILNNQVSFHKIRRDLSSEDSHFYFYFY